MKLHLCFDWDWTLLKIHTGGIYRELTEEDFVNLEKIKMIFRKIIEGGHLASIVTHGDMEETEKMIKEGLAIIGLSEEEIDSIPIITGMTADKKVISKKRKKLTKKQDDGKQIKTSVRS